MESKYAQTIKLVLELNSKSWSNRQIAKTCGVNHRTVSEWLKRHHKESHVARQPIETISPTLGRCSRCKEPKPLEEFQYGRKGQQYEYRFSYCNSCRKKQAYLNLNTDHRKALKEKFNRVRRRAAKEGIVFSLTWDYILKVFVYQHQHCFYDESKLLDWSVGAGRKPTSVSFDRIDPEKGYILGNVILCCNRINTIKNDVTLEEMEQWMPSWYAKAVNWLENWSTLLSFASHDGAY